MWKNIKPTIVHGFFLGIVIGTILSFFLNMKIDDFYFGKYPIRQEISNGRLYTWGVYNNENIYYSQDVITINTTDSIKIIRYKEAETLINKFKKLTH